MLENLLDRELMQLHSSASCLSFKRFARVTYVVIKPHVRLLRK
jgi:hypothetical protein